MNIQIAYKDANANNIPISVGIDSSNNEWINEDLGNRDPEARQRDIITMQLWIMDVILLTVSRISLSLNIYDLSRFFFF